MTTEITMRNKFNGMEIPLVLAVIALFCWHFPLLLPVKLLTVFFHELSHGLAAILTGGSIVSIGLNLNQGGICYSTGGWRFITASAGYLGSLLWGCGLLLASMKRGINRSLTEAIGVLLLIAAALWMRDFQSLAISIITGLGLIYIAAKLNEKYCTVILRFISLVSCFYVVWDIKDDLIDRIIPGSDAYAISKMIFPQFMVGAGSYIVGIIWLAIAVYVLWKTFKIAFK